MYGDLGKGLTGMFYVMATLSVCGVVAILALVVVTANTWDCSIQVDRQPDQSGKGGTDG